MSPRSWPTHGARRVHNGEWRYYRFGAERWLRITEPNMSVAPVVLAEDPAGPYWGWLGPGDSEVPSMVQPTRQMFAIQFPYGPDVMESAGHGRTVRLRVIEA